MSDLEEEMHGEEEEDEGEELEAEMDETDQFDEEDIDEFEEGFEEEEEKEVDPNPLVHDHMYGGALYMLEHVGTGLSCAYVRLDVSKKELTDIDMLEKFIHLRYVDVSQNYITDITPLSNMTHLCSLNASKNRLSFIHLDELPFLQTADLSHNKLVSMEGINHPMLQELNLASNRISKINFSYPEKLDCLKVLDLRGNRISKLEAEFPPNLEEMYLPSNVIKTLEGMGKAPKLVKLHLRDNQLENLDGIDEEKLPSLTYLNLRGNNIEEAKHFKKIRNMETITEIILEGNPLTDSDNYREEVIAALGCRKSIKRIDKDEMDDEELTLAMDIMEKMDKEEEKKDEEEGELGLTGEKSTDSELKFTLDTNITSNE